MLKSLFESQRKYLDHFFDHLNHEAAEKVLHHLLQCEGALFFTGVGKSGHIAEKVAATFSSIGAKAYFLNPGNALHGDIGILAEKDICLFFSKSGNSQELVNLIPYVKKRGVFSVAVVSALDSNLAKKADCTVILPVEKEICPFDLAPTTSTAAQLIFGDCLAVSYMQMKNISIADFAANHPGGVLGRKISFKVQDLMLKGELIPQCKPDDLLIHVLHELSQKRCGCLLVADDSNQLQGIFTDGDLRRAIESKGSSALSIPISEFMTRTFKSITPDKLAFEAAHKMEEDLSRLITALPVLEEGKVVGLVRIHDILQKEFP